MYLCKVCVKEKHDKHKCTKLSDYLNMAINRIKFQEYNDYVKFLNWKEIATKDQVNSDKIKTLDIIDRCINDLQEAKKQYIKVTMEGKRGALCMIRQTKDTGFHIDFKSKVLAKLDDNYRSMLIEKYNCSFLALRFKMLLIANSY